METKSAPPLDIKAEGIALLCLGYSARTVEKMLKEKFPGEKIPRYSTISRWLSHRGATKYLKRSVQIKWALAAGRAGDLIDERFDEMRNAPFSQLIKAYDRIWDVYLRSKGL